MVKNFFWEITKSLATVLLKMKLFICIYPLFLKTLLKIKPIENCHIKLDHVYFNDFNIFFTNVCHLKIDFL